MSCVPFFRRNDNKQEQLQIHAIVEQPLTILSQGKIRCSVIGIGSIKFEWIGDGREIQLDESRSEAYGLRPGFYTVRAVDEANGIGEISVQIQPILPKVIIVTEYIVQHCSSGSARDGHIQAKGDGLNTWNRFLWSNGCITSEPVLRDACRGMYSITPLPIHGRILPFVHYCSPGIISVTPIAFHTA